MKKIFLALFIVLSMFLVSCGSSDSVKEAVNDTSIFSQDEIDYVNAHIEEIKQYGYTVTSKTINSKTMEIIGNYNHKDEDTGNTVTATFSEKIEKKNSIVMNTYVDSKDGTDISYELSIPRVFGDFENGDYFTTDEDNSFRQLVLDSNSNIPIHGFSTAAYDDNGLCQIGILITENSNVTLIKDNNKYYCIDSNGIIAITDTLKSLIENPNVILRINNLFFSGIYSGTYFGDDTGNWNITVNSDGSITGTTTSTGYGGTYNVTGTLSGNTATLTATSGATLTTTISSTGVVNGTWTNSSADISGSLTGNKE